MSVCSTVLVLRFYGCCHPCYSKLTNAVIEQWTANKSTSINFI